MIKKSDILLTAFRGTSSEKLIARFDDTYRKIILENDKNASVNQLADALESYKVRSVISFGQKPVIKDKIYIELAGRIGGTLYKTDLDTDRLAETLSRRGFQVRVSSNAGTSFCNHLYACGMKHISENHYGTRMVFIHVPFEKNISDFKDYSDRLIEAISDFCT